MIPGVFIIALIIIILLSALPYIFKRIFKTRNFMGYDIGLCSSFFTLVAIFGVFVFGCFLFLVFFNRASNTIIFLLFLLYLQILFYFYLYLIIQKEYQIQINHIIVYLCLLQDIYFLHLHLFIFIIFLFL